MGLHLHASADERITLFLACDPSIAAVNNEVDLAALVRGERTQTLITPEDASQVVIAPLAPSTMAYARRAAGAIPGAAIAIRARLLEKGGDNVYAALQELSEDEQQSLGELNAWQESFNRELVSLGLVEISDWPDVVPAKIGGYRRYPAAMLDRFPMELLAELAGHIARVSSLDAEGKAPSSSPSGADMTDSPEPGGALTAEGSAGASVETAEGHSARA